MPVVLFPWTQQCLSLFEILSLFHASRSVPLDSAFYFNCSHLILNLITCEIKRREEELPYQPKMSLLLGNITLLSNGTEVVNEPRPLAFSWVNAPLLALTAIINFWAATVIRRNERTSLNKAIVYDCFANILSMAILAFLQSPWYRLGSPILCTLQLFLTLFLFNWNKLIPVGMAAFRYLMVCHAVFCHNQGGERKIWRILSCLILGFCLTTAAIGSAAGTSFIGYLRCINREEMFRRSNLEDFYQPLEASGLQFSGPLWSPHRLLLNASLFLFAFLIPLLYGAVFMFRRKHTNNITGFGHCL